MFDELDRETELRQLSRQIELETQNALGENDEQLLERYADKEKMNPL